MECCGNDLTEWIIYQHNEMGWDGYFIDQHAINIMNNGEWEIYIIKNSPAHNIQETYF